MSEKRPPPDDPRENIYLNGAILGMKRVEIERKFDEIVAFAEVLRRGGEVDFGARIRPWLKACDDQWSRLWGKEAPAGGAEMMTTRSGGDEKMGEILSLQDIRRRYSGEWLLIAYAELDDEMNVIRGEVLAHSPDRDEIYRELLSVKGKSVAVEYAGSLPEDLAVVLCFQQVVIQWVEEFWARRPCNIRHSPKPVRTREYFDEVEARKYFVSWMKEARKRL